MSGDLTPEEQEAFDRLSVNTMGIRGALGLGGVWEGKVDSGMVKAVLMALRESLREFDADPENQVDLAFVEDPDDKTVMILGFSESWVAAILQGLLRLLEIRKPEKFVEEFGWLAGVPELDKGATEGETPS